MKFIAVDVFSTSLVLVKFNCQITWAFCLFPILLPKLCKYIPPIITCVFGLGCEWCGALPPQTVAQGFERYEDPDVQEPTLSFLSSCRYATRPPTNGSLAHRKYSGVHTCWVWVVCFWCHLQFVSKALTRALSSISLIERLANIKLNCFHPCF